MLQTHVEGFLSAGDTSTYWWGKGYIGAYWEHSAKRGSRLRHAHPVSLHPP